MEQKHYRKWAYTAAFAASFAAAMPLEAAPAENVAAEPQSQAVVAIPDITAVPVEVVPAPVVTEEEALARQEAEEAKLRAEAERKAAEEAERKAVEEAARKAEEERRADRRREPDVPLDDLPENAAPMPRKNIPSENANWTFFWVSPM